MLGSIKGVCMTPGLFDTEGWTQGFMHVSQALYTPSPYISFFLLGGVGDDFWDKVSLCRSFWVSWNLLCRQNLKDLRASTSWVMGLNDYATTPSNPFIFFCFQKGSGFILCSPGSPWPFALPVSVSQGPGIRLVTEQAQMCRFYRYCYDFSPTDCTVLGRVGSQRIAIQRTLPLQCCAVPEQTLGLGELISLLVSLSWQ